MLTIKELTKVYPTGTRALNKVSFSIEDPIVVAVIGPSGSGKSTLIRCINRLIEPTSGSILLKEMEITKLNRRGLRKARRRMGMIFQEYNLVERLTVMENLLSGRLGYVSLWQAFLRKFPREDVANAFRLLDRVGLTGYHDTRADALSGGERQRVGIARALMQSPDLLLVDEPTASLDPRTSRQIMRLLVELSREFDTLTIVNIHDVGLAQMFADRIIGLRKGEVVFDGHADQVDETVLTDIYGEEDWSATIRKVPKDTDAEEEVEEEDKPEKPAQQKSRIDFDSEAMKG